MLNYQKSFKYSSVLSFACLIAAGSQIYSPLAAYADTSQNSQGTETDAESEMMTAINIRRYTASSHPTITMKGALSVNDIALCNQDGIYCNPDTYETTVFTSKVKCEGGNGDGGWLTKTFVNDIETTDDIALQQCWRSLDVCFDEAMTQCQTFSLEKDNVPAAALVYHSLSPSGVLAAQNNFSYCSGNDGDTNKEYCIWNNDYKNDDGDTKNYSEQQSAKMAWRYADGTTVQTGTNSGYATGETNDDMFRLPPQQDFFLEYVDLDASTESAALMRVKRGGSTGDRDMMIPAGPRGTLSDFKAFMTDPPADIVDIQTETACFPAKVSLTCDTDQMVLDPIEGICGNHNGHYVYNDKVDDLSADGYCASGGYNKISDSSWTCVGYNGGNTASCSIGILSYNQPTTNNNDDGGNSGSSSDDGGGDEYADVDGDGDGDMSIGEAEKAGVDYDVENNYNGDDGTDSNDGSVVCTYFYQKGMLSTRDWRSNWIFTKRHLPQEVVDGYHVWAVPYVRLMRKSALAEKLMFPIMEAWTQERAFQMGHRNNPNYAGKLVRAILEPLCFAIGKIAGAQDYKALYKDHAKTA